MNNDLCYLSATEALGLFKSKALSPVELMQALIAQSERLEPDINAFSHEFFDQALLQAGESEARYMRGEPMGVLDGVAVGIKDESDVKGQPNTEGSLIHQHRVGESDAVYVARLRKEGAIFHARTTCPEFCSLWNTHSRLFGITRNPWNLDITPGGSSGGSGASLAAGTSTLASGSDIGGSIRFPASMCGLIGFKPPFGRVPESLEPYAVEPYCANGPMARTVADTALMQNVISGADPADAASTLADVTIPLSFEGDLRGRRIAYNMDFNYLEIEPDVIRNTLDAIERLKSLGAELLEVELNWPSGIERAYYGHMDPLFFAHLEKLIKTEREQMCDYNIQMAEEALQRVKDNQAFYNSACVETKMYAEFGSMMEHFDAFVCPTVTNTKLPADFNPSKDKYYVNGKEQEYDLTQSSCHFFNMMGRCPSMSVPSGLGDNGVPSGLQIVSQAFDDIAVFRVAAALESTWSEPWRPSSHTKPAQPEKGN